ncbi:MAG TPA: cation transporter [Longimicrobiales bacterium]|nr:cation transporter [Longimicrobiales bacterium]
MATATLKVTGMSCDHCVRAVTQALQNTDGVRSAHVDLKGARATVEYDEGKTNPQALASAVTEEGYQAEETV